MSIWDIFEHVSPTSLVEAAGKALDGELWEATKTLGKSAAIKEGWERVSGKNSTDEDSYTPNDD